MSDPRLPVEVDPWSDGHWSRVERDLFEKLDATGGARAPERRPALRRRVVIGGLAAAAALALVFYVRPPGFLRSSDRLRVATTDSASEVTVGESSLVVAPKSLVMVSGDDDRGVDVVLDRGAVTCEVAPRKGRPAFVVDAGEVRVRVMGTRFTVARYESAVSVVVDHGAVEVSASGQVTVLHDGERWPIANASEGANEREGANGGAADETQGNEKGAHLAVSSSAPIGGTDRLRAKAAAGRPSSPEVGAVASSPPSPSPSPSPSTATATATAAAVPPPAPSPQETYEAAARLEKTRPDDAAALYRGLASGNTAWTSSALYALARLEADRGHREGAQHLLEDYLARYPRGLNADDARALVQRMR
jgi:FecR protein